MLVIVHKQKFFSIEFALFNRTTILQRNQMQITLRFLLDFIKQKPILVNGGINANNIYIHLKRMNETRCFSANPI